MKLRMACRATRERGGSREPGSLDRIGGASGGGPLRRVRRGPRASIAAASVLFLACDVDAETPPEPTRETMQKAFDSLSVLLPAALSRSGWDDAARRDEVQQALQALAGAARELSEHGGAADPSFRFLGQSLGSDARAIQRRVAQRRYESASYLTQRLTETCVACHVRLPSKSAAGLGDTLLERLDRGSLTPLARARLQTATRQFDAALDTYEAQFASPAAAAALLEYDLPSYLIVALRVRQDAARAQRGLALLAQRTDLSTQLRRNLATWRAALEELAPALKQEPSLERAREILAQGRAATEFPDDGADLVHAIVATSLVFRFIEAREPQGRALAEALYLLGQTEAFTRRSFELAEAEFYLEQAIRLAPRTALAERAFARLERDTLLGYTGSGGEQVPDDVRAWLEELRELSRSSGPT